MNLDEALLLLVPLAPLLLLGAMLIRSLRSASMSTLPLAAVPALLGALILPGSVVEWDWMLLGARWGLDSIGQRFLLFSAVLWLVAGWYANAYIKSEAQRASYALFHLLAMSGNFGLIIAEDSPSFFLFFALMSFASYGLVIHNRDLSAMWAGKVYLALVVLGEVILLTALLRWSVASEGVLLPGAGGQPDRWTAILFFIGFGIKAGVFPLHVWLPLAHPAAPVPASALMSGVMIKAGLLGWIRFLPGSESSDATLWVNALAGMGMATAFGGALLGCLQSNLKAVLAYSSISQMGLMTAAVGLSFQPGGGAAALTAVTLFAAHHALCKGALFLSVGLLAHPPKLPRWLFIAALLVPALCLAGAPFTGGGLVKGLLKSLGPGWGSWKILLSLSSVGTTLLMLRFFQLGRASRVDDGHAPAARGLWGPWLVLVVMSALFPIWASTIQSTVPSSHWWSKIWPLIVGLGMYRLLLFRVPMDRPIIAPGDILSGVLVLLEGMLNMLRAGSRFVGRLTILVRWRRRNGLRKASRMWRPMA